MSHINQFLHSFASFAHSVKCKSCYKFGALFTQLFVKLCTKFLRASVDLCQLACFEHMHQTSEHR